MWKNLLRSFYFQFDKFLFYLEFTEHEIVNLCLLPIWGSCQPSLFQFFFHHTFSSVQFSSVTQSWLTLCDPMDCSMPGFSLSITNPQRGLKLMSIESVTSSNQLILCHPLLLPSIFPSIRVFSNESILSIRWPKYWSFSFSISPSNEYSRLISFRID